MKKTLLSALALVALSGAVTSCGKEQNDAPQLAGNTSVRATATPVTDAPAGSITSDSLALVDLFNSLNGMEWSYSNNWVSDRPVATWAGVKVSDVAGAPRVTALYLGGNKLRGELPKSIGQLTALRTLQLQYNRELTGSIPAELYQLTQLRSLRLRFTSLTGTLSPAIGKLSQLDTLDLSNSRYDLSMWWDGDPATAKAHRPNGKTLSGELPREIGQLTKVRYLDLSFQGFTGALPTEIGALKSLKYLSLYGCRLSGELPASLGDLDQLEYLSAGLNDFSGELPASLGSLKSIREIHISGNKLSGSIPASLGALKTLQQLNLAGNQLTGAIPAALSQLEGLYVIDLSRNKLSGNIPTDFGGAQQELLLAANLSHNELTGAIPARIKRYLPEAAKYAHIHGLPDYGYTMFVLSGNKLTGKIPAEYLAYPKTLQLLLPQQAGYGFSNEPK